MQCSYWLPICVDDAMKQMEHPYIAIEANTGELKYVCVCLFYYKKKLCTSPLFVTQLEEYYLTYISENFFCNSNYIFVWLHGPIIALKHTNLERGVESKAIKSSTIPRYSFSKCKFTPSEFGSPKVVSLSNLFFYGDDNTIVRVQIVMISKGLRKT